MNYLKEDKKRRKSTNLFTNERLKPLGQRVDHPQKDFENLKKDLDEARQRVQTLPGELKDSRPVSRGRSKSRPRSSQPKAEGRGPRREKSPQMREDRSLSPPPCNLSAYPSLGPPREMRLVDLMGQVNRLRKNQIERDPKSIFQKVSKHKPQGSALDEKDEDFQAYLDIIHQGRQRPKNPSSPASISKIIFKTQDSENHDVKAKFKRRVDRMTSYLQILSGYVKKQSEDKPAPKPPLSQGVGVQCSPSSPKPIALSNLNTGNLVKEFGKSFMVASKLTNPLNRGAQSFLAETQPKEPKGDPQKKRLFAEMFSTFQEQALVEEAFRIIQEKGYDLEGLFVEAYRRLAVNSVTDPPTSPEKKASEELPVDCEVSGMSLQTSPEAQNMALGSLGQDFSLDFGKLDVSKSVLE